MFKVSYVYKETATSIIYSSLAFGNSIVYTNETFITESPFIKKSRYFDNAMQVTFIGLSAGKKVRFSTEFGAGYRGVFNIGINKHF